MKAADFIKKLRFFKYPFPCAPNETKLQIITFKQIYKKN